MALNNALRCWGGSGGGTVVGAIGYTIGGSGIVDVYNAYDQLPGVQDVVVGLKHTCVLMIATSGIRCFGYNP